MTLIVQSVNTIGAGTRIALTTQSDTLNVIRGVSVVTTDDNPAIACSVASSSDVLQIAGQVSGSYGVDFTGASGGASLLVGSAGSLTGDAGDGVNLAGYGTITNYGQIDGSGNGVEANDLTLYNYGSVSFEKFGNTAILVSGSSYIDNYGSIGEIYFESTSVANTLYNYGTISGTIYDFSDNATNTEQCYNAGTITAGSNGVAFISSGTAPSNFTNAGSIIGEVELFGGPADFNSTNGSVSGEIVAAAGSGVVIAGNTGGTVIGGSGNDVLTANPTQTAANNAAKTTLDGRTGNNWLYGDGAFTTFDSGDNAAGTYNQMFGGHSQMSGVAGYANNTVSYAGVSSSYKSAYIDLLHGDAYMCKIAKASGAPAADLVFEDYLTNVPDVVGSSGSDVIICDNGVDRITHGSGAGDVLYAGTGASSQDTFAYTSLNQSPLSNHDTIEGFKVGTDKIDLSALAMPAADVFLSYGGNGANTIYVEKNPSSGFNSATDMIISVQASTHTALGYGDLVL